MRKRAKRIKALKVGLLAVACVAVLSLGVFAYTNQEDLFMLRAAASGDPAVADDTPGPALTPEASVTPDETPESTQPIPEETPMCNTAAPEEATPEPGATDADGTEDVIIPANPIEAKGMEAAGYGEEGSLADDPGDELRLAGVKIGIDPGHQGKGNSAQEPVAPGSSETKAKVSSGTAGVKTRIAEHVTNLEISLKLRDALEAEGAEVYMTRETADVDISNVERAEMMNELNVDLVLRIHCNGSTNQSANGIGLYVRKTGANADECLRAAEALLPEMVSATGAREDGIFLRDTYSGLNWSEVPSILVEMGFMSNAEEDVLLNTPEYQDKLVKGMVEGTAAYCLTPKSIE